jgi:hypothetical protein
LIDDDGEKVSVMDGIKSSSGTVSSPVTTSSAIVFCDEKSKDKQSRTALNSSVRGVNVASDVAPMTLYVDDIVEYFIAELGCPTLLLSLLPPEEVGRHGDFEYGERDSSEFPSVVSIVGTPLISSTSSSSPVATTTTPAVADAATANHGIATAAIIVDVVVVLVPMKDLRGLPSKGNP